MNIRTPELEILEDKPFCADKLDREKLESPLSQFVKSVDGPMVLAIDGGWGTGKTTFLKMWMRKLQIDGHACLYLNAWQSDFAEDPLAALIGELSAMISDPKFSGESQKALRKHLKTVKKAGGKILKRALPVLVRMGTAGLLDVGDLVEKEVPDLAATLVEDQIEEYEKKKLQIDEFRKSLMAFVEEFGKTGGPSMADAKVVLIVDELDRCRPTYAIELLERIKHLFDVPGMIFILGVDRGQLCHSICGLYGAGFDAAGYLRRFVDIDYRLPEPERGRYCALLFETFEISKLRSKWPARKLDLDASGMCWFLDALFGAAKLPLRTQQQIVARLWIVMQAIPANHALFTFPLLLLVFLRDCRQDFYFALASGRVKVGEIIDSLALSSKETEHSLRRQHDFIEATLLAGAAELEPESELLRAYRKEREKPQDAEGRDARKIEILALAEELASDFLYAGVAGFKINLDRIAMTEHFDVRDQ